MNIEAYYKITYGLYVVSAAHAGKLNGYVSNTVFQVSSDPAQFAISCSKNNLTAGIISESKVFAISALKKDVKATIIGAFGYRSGKDIEKFSNLDYKIGKTGAPILLEDTLAWFECKVVQTVDVGSHLLFIGEVVDGDLVNAVSEPLTYAWYRDVRKGKSPKNAPTYIDTEKIRLEAEAAAAIKFYCTACGHIYDPMFGDPDSGIPAGTKLEDIPANWVCPVCGAEKADFARIE
jgi:flavin reductase (DIM6/NTAB) family NADH-FMN oxidoreductase RutF